MLVGLQRICLLASRACRSRLVAVLPAEIHTNVVRATRVILLYFFELSVSATEALRILSKAIAIVTNYNPRNSGEHLIYRD